MGVYLDRGGHVAQEPPFVKGDRVQYIGTCRPGENNRGRIVKQVGNLWRIAFDDGSYGLASGKNIKYTSAELYADEELRVTAEQIIPGSDGDARASKEPDCACGKPLPQGCTACVPKNLPDDNPKTAVGQLKVPMQLVPTAAKIRMAEAMADGAKKYGPFNWRDKPVSVSTYMGALQRHIDAWYDGEDTAQDSGVHHLGHAMACLGIIVDAQAAGTLNDDRPSKGGAVKLQDEFHATQLRKRDVKAS